LTAKIGPVVHRISETVQDRRYGKLPGTVIDT